MYQQPTHLAQLHQYQQSSAYKNYPAEFGLGHTLVEQPVGAGVKQVANTVGVPSMALGQTGAVSQAQPCRLEV